jgi:signal transduction histidine kinase
MRRSELEFVLMASGFGVFFGIAFFLAPIIFGNQELGQFLPLVVIVIDGFIAYGIATRRILDVPQVLSRIVAYLLLAVYLGLVYAAAWFPTDLLVRHVVHTSLTLPHFIAVFAVVVSVVPAHGRLQEFVNRLMGMTRAFDATAMLNRGLHVLGSISTLDELLAQFAAVVQAGVGTDRVVLLLREDGHFRQAYPPAGSRMEIPDDDAIPALLRDQHEPLSADLLPRYTYTAGVAQAINRLAELQVSVAVGIETKGRLETLMLLGPRLSGRIYATPELTTLQLLSNHLGVALENAKLYTQVQDNAIYTNNLLEHLVSGVIAAGPDRRITVFNREAQRISGMTPADTMGRSISCLPAPLYDMLNDVYAIGAGPREKELVLNSDRREDQLTLRAGSTLFHGSKGQMLGALLVFHDVSAVKRLESQVRRGDRLASMGTLAAGMAHEIKNPLQTLKTFTQLLGERYDDPEFRGSFTDLVGSEVQRIDTIVNQLLRFARPAKPVLVPIHVHSVVENTLRLLQQQMKQRNITAVRKLDAPSDFIRGDADLLHQAMINFFLNAVDAMPAGGSLTLRTEIIAPAGSHRNGGSAEASLRLSISDSGTGIGPDVIPHIFDPFYTTKNTGTGLGLSVSHGIITEHGGFIDVESVPQHGTTFHLHFPLCTAEVPA